MKRNFLRIAALVGTITSFILFFCQPAFSQDTVTLSGTVNSEFQFVSDDGDTYEIGETVAGESLTELESERVEVTGTILDMDGILTIMISKYQVISTTTSSTDG